MMYTIVISSDGMIYVKIGTCVQGIIRFCICNLRGCNIGIIDVRDL
jgi:hypothetical protein